MIPNTKMIKPKNVNSFVKSDQDEIYLRKMYNFLKGFIRFGLPIFYCTFVLGYFIFGFMFLVA